MGEAEKLCDEIVLVHDGKVVRAGPLAEVKASGGTNAVHIEFEGDGSFLGELPGIAAARIDTNRAELRLSAGVDAQDVLSASVSRLRILRFEVVAPSLEEVFLDAVGGGAASRSQRRYSRAAAAGINPAAAGSGGWTGAAPRRRGRWSNS